MPPPSLARTSEAAGPGGGRRGLGLSMGAGGLALPSVPTPPSAPRWGLQPAAPSPLHQAHRAGKVAGAGAVPAALPACQLPRVHAAILHHIQAISACSSQLQALEARLREAQSEADVRRVHEAAGAAADA